MLLSNMPGCCTAKVLHELNSDRYIMVPTPTFPTLPMSKNLSSLKEGILIAIEASKKDGNAVLIVSTTLSQRAANKVLKELGFIPSPWMKKTRHPETKLKVWYLPLHK